MGLTHFLKADETIEQLAEQLRLLVNRPVYIAGGHLLPAGINHLYREPGKVYFRTINRLEIFLSRYDTSYCLERTENDVFKYDLVPSKFVSLIYPLLPEERSGKDEYYKDEYFPKIGLECAINGDRRIIFPNRDETIPEELHPFLREYRDTKPRTYEEVKGFPRRQGIRFAVSMPIETPVTLKKNWHLGEVFGKPEIFGPNMTIQAPGWYNGSKKGRSESINRLGVVDQKPGGCIVCHGASSESKHLAVIAHDSDAYPDGLVCRTCLPEAMKQWKEILDGWTPTHEQKVT